MPEGEKSLNPTQVKGAVNVKRRTWDTAEYEQKAAERAERENEVKKAEVVHKDREEFQAAQAGAAGPLGSRRAFLSARKGKVDLESKLGKTEVGVCSSSAILEFLTVRAMLHFLLASFLQKINTTGTSATQAGGYYCEVCECMLKDNVAYIDHINGTKRTFANICQRNCSLGFRPFLRRSTGSWV
jgi:U4/U6.U5 tri-snRNP component SNU23